MTNKTYQKATNIRNEIEDLKILRDLTFQPYRRYSLTKKFLWISSYDRKTTCLCDQGLTEVIREYCDKRIEELNEELKSL